MTRSAEVESDVPPLKAAVLKAAGRVLHALAKLLIECGVGVGELHRLSKAAFIQAARESVPEGHRPNISRIALLTGLNRGEVAELLSERAERRPEPLKGRQRGERVLSGWWNDSEFHDDSGQPAALPLRGARSFTTLVQRYSGEPQVATLLDELIRVKAVRRRPDGKLEALSRTCATVRWDPDSVAAVGDIVHDHLETLLHNIRHPSRVRYERIVLNPHVDPRYVPILTRDMGANSDVLANSIDNALNDPQVTLRPGHTVQDAVRLGIAIYIFEEPSVIEPSRAEGKAPDGRSKREKSSKKS